MAVTHAFAVVATRPCILNMPSEILSHMTMFYHRTQDILNVARMLMSAHAPSTRRPLWRYLLELIQYTWTFRFFHVNDANQFVALIDHVVRNATLHHVPVVLCVRRVYMEELPDHYSAQSRMVWMHHAPFLDHIHAPFEKHDAFDLNNGNDLAPRSLSMMMLPLAAPVPYTRLTSIQIYGFPTSNETHVHELCAAFPPSLTLLEVQSFNAFTLPHEPWHHLSRLQCLRLDHVHFLPGALEAAHQFQCTMEIFRPFWDQLHELCLMPKNRHFVHRLVAIPLPMALRVLRVITPFHLINIQHGRFIYESKYVQNMAELRVQFVEYMSWRRMEMWKTQSLLQDDVLLRVDAFEDVRTFEQRRRHKQILDQILFLIHNFDQYHALTSQDDPSVLQAVQLQKELQSFYDSDTYTSYVRLDEFYQDLWEMNRSMHAMLALGQTKKITHSPYLGACRLLMGQLQNAVHTRKMTILHYHIVNPNIYPSNVEYMLQPRRM